MENPDYREYKRIESHRWYQSNKERQKINVLRDYHKNKKKWHERRYVYYYKDYIWSILGRVCKNCGKEANEINHLKYDFPKRTTKGTKEEKRNYLIEYCSFLEPLCMPCHKMKKPRTYEM